MRLSCLSPPFLFPGRSKVRRRNGRALAINISINCSRYWRLDRYSSQVSGMPGLIHGHCQGETRWRIHVAHSANPWKMKWRARAGKWFTTARFHLREFSDLLRAAWLEMRCVLNRFRPSGHLLRLMAPDRWRAVRFGGVLRLAQVTDRCRISPGESRVRWCQVLSSSVYKRDLSVSQMFTGWWFVSAAYERIRSFSFAERSQAPP